MRFLTSLVRAKTPAADGRAGGINGILLGGGIRGRRLCWGVEEVHRQAATIVFMQSSSPKRPTQRPAGHPRLRAPFVQGKSCKSQCSRRPAASAHDKRKPTSHRAQSLRPLSGNLHREGVYRLDDLRPPSTAEICTRISGRGIKLRNACCRSAVSLTNAVDEGR